MARTWLISLVAGVIAWQAGAQQPAPAGRPLAEWIRDLQSKDVLAREEAILVLGAMGPAAKDALPALTALLKDPAATVRSKAALAAWQIDCGTKEAVPVLLDVLATGSRPLRLHVLAAVGPMAEEVPQVLVALLRATDDPDLQIRAKAQESVDKLSASAVPALTRTVEHDEAWLGKKAIARLARFGPGAKAALPVLTARLKDDDRETRFAAAQAVWAVDRRVHAVVRVLVQAADKPEAGPRRSAFMILMQIKPPPREALPVFRAALKDAELGFQLQAAEILWPLDKNADDVMPVLLRALDTPTSPGVPTKARALEILAQMGEHAKPVRTRLVELMKTGDPSVQFSLPRVLARLGPESIPALVDMLSAPGPKRPSQFMAAQTLGHLGAEAVSPLVKLLRHEDDTVRLAAFQALELMGPQAEAATPVLKDALKSPDASQRLRAANCLSQIGPDAKDAVAALIDAIQDSDANVRRAALVALTTVGVPAAQVRPRLEKALKDGNNLVRIAAADLLWQIDPRSKDVMDTIIELLKDRAGADFHAGQLLVRMGADAKPAFPTLMEMLGSANVQERIRAALTIHQLGPRAKETAPALVRAMQTPDANVRAMVLHALRSIGVRDKALVPLLIGMLDTMPLFTELNVFPLLIDHGPDARAALDKVRKRLTFEQPQIRLLAAETVLAIDPKQLSEVRPILEAFMKGPSTFDGLQAARIWWQLDPQDDKPLRFLEEALRDPGPVMKYTAAQALVPCGPWAKAILPALILGLEDSSVLVRVSTARAVRRIDPGNNRVVPALIEVLQQKNDLDSRQQAILGLGEMGPAAREAIPWLRAALRDAPPLRIAATGALRRIDPRAALPQLTP